MSKRFNGGQAFPRAGTIYPAGEEWPVDGMTLRDWFAGQALAGLLAKGAAPDLGAPDFAVDAYCFADDMLRERER